MHACASPYLPEYRLSILIFYYPRKDVTEEDVLINCEMTSSSDQGGACSSSLVVLGLRIYDELHQWEATLRDVSHAGSAESEASLHTRNVKVFAQNGRVYYRGPNNKPVQIKNMSEIPSETMHFQKASKARFAKPNGLDTAYIEALTRAIYEGEIWITGDYACVNHLGTYPSNSAPKLRAETPVPIKLLSHYEADALIARHEVTVAETEKIPIYVCHFKSVFSSSEGATPLSPQRIYFAGWQRDPGNSLSPAGAHYSNMLQQTPWSAARADVKAERRDVTIVGLTNGLITAFYNNYEDGVVLEYSASESHVIGTSIPSIPNEAHWYPYAVWESSSDGRHIKIISDEDVKGVWEYKTTIWIPLAHSGIKPLADHNIQKAARAFKGLTLEGYARMINASLIDVIASFQRTNDPYDGGERVVGGYSCYLYQGESNYTMSKYHIVASAMRRDELEGVVVVATPHGDYSLRTGAKARYTCDDDGVWYMGPRGHMESIAPSDLVGAKLN